MNIIIGTNYSLSNFGYYPTFDQTQTLTTVCLKLFAEMSCQCSIFRKNFASLPRLRRHRKVKHKIKTQKEPLQCKNCDLESSSLVGMIKHTKQLHGSEIFHHCVYCSNTFWLKSAFEDHIIQNHGMQQLRIKGHSGDLPVMSSIDRKLTINSFAHVRHRKWHALFISLIKDLRFNRSTEVRLKRYRRKFIL